MAEGEPNTDEAVDPATSAGDDGAVGDPKPDDIDENDPQKIEKLTSPSVPGDPDEGAD